MGTPAQIRSALASSLASLVSGGTLGHVYQYVPSNPTPPCAWIGDGPIAYDLTFGRGLDELTFTVSVLIAFTLDEQAQATMDSLRDTSNVKTLIEADPTLGGAASGLQVTDATGSQLRLAQGQPPGCGTTWTVLVKAVT